jgi:hypothetical protein
MAKETIGLVMVDWESFANRQDGAPLMGFGYVPVKQLPDGTVRVLSISLAKKYAEMGLKPVVSVVSEVTRHGTKVTHRGYDLHFVEGAPPSMQETLKHLGPVIVDGLIGDFYDKLGATTEPIAKAKDDRS